MEVVINIPEELAETICEQTYDEHEVWDTMDAVRYAIRKNNILPKGHGDLVDRSKICKAIPAEEDNCTGMGMTLEEMEAYNDGIDAMYRLVQGELTIIEADKEDNNERLD